MNFKNGFVKVAGVALAVASGASFAQSSSSIDTSGVVATVTEGGTAGGVIGAAVLTMLVGIAAYKWIRKAL